MDNTPTDMSAALFAAIDSGDEARVMQLINAGADIFVTDADGLTTLTHARRQGNETIISALEMMDEACGKEWEEPVEEDVEEEEEEEEEDSITLIEYVQSLQKSAEQGDVEAALALVAPHVVSPDDIVLPFMGELRDALRRFPAIRRHPQYLMFERAIRGFPDAQRELAAIYDHRNRRLSRLWHKEAAKYGDAEAQFQWAKICKSDDRDDTAASWYIRSALQGRENAYFEAGNIYRALFIDRKPTEASEKDNFTVSAHYLALARGCYKRDAERGSEEAIRALAELQGEDSYPISIIRDIYDIFFATGCLAFGAAIMLFGYSMFAGIFILLIGLFFIMAGLSDILSHIRCRAAWRDGLREPIECLLKECLDLTCYDIGTLTIAPAPEEGL